MDPKPRAVLMEPCHEAEPLRRCRPASQHLIALQYWQAIEELTRLRVSVPNSINLGFEILYLRVGASLLQDGRQVACVGPGWGARGWFPMILED